MQSSEYALLNLFADGGPMMYPLILCSLLSVGVIIAKFYTFWLAQRQSRMILSEVAELTGEGNIEQAMDLAERTPGPVAAILLAGLRRVFERHTEGKDIEKAVKTTGSIELGFLERGLPLLATVANVAPLMGFLGTVAGMISAFGAIAEAGQVEATLVAGGIKVALITTASGLIIAVPVNVAYNYFVIRIDKLIVEMEHGTLAVLNMIWDLDKRGGPQFAAAGGSASGAAAGTGSAKGSKPPGSSG